MDIHSTNIIPTHFCLLGLSKQITMHLSMHEQHVITPWIKTFPKKVVQRVTTYLWPAGTIAFIYGVIEVSNSVDYAEDMGHRF